MTHQEYIDLYNKYTDKDKKVTIEKFYDISKRFEVNDRLPMIYPIENHWKVYRNQCIPDGIYVTARIQLNGGINTMLNEFKDNAWVGQCPDGGYVIAYKEVSKEQFEKLI